MRTDRLVAILLIAACAAGLACAPTISTFSARALEYATSIKVEALSLMEKATEPYADHEAEAAELGNAIEQAFEYARARPKNELSVTQWEKLKDPNGHLLGGFLARWESDSVLSQVFVSEQTRIVEDAFGTIIDLEAGKRKPKEAQGR